MPANRTRAAVVQAFREALESLDAKPQTALEALDALAIRLLGPIGAAHYFGDRYRKLSEAIDRRTQALGLDTLTRASEEIDSEFTDAYTDEPPKPTPRPSSLPPPPPPSVYRGTTIVHVPRGRHR